MPMRARGGRCDGEATEANLKDWADYASANSNKGKRVAKMTGGAISGVGRLEKARDAKRGK
jgi:hypothetical protein